MRPSSRQPTFRCAGFLRCLVIFLQPFATSGINYTMRFRAGMAARAQRNDMLGRKVAFALSAFTDAALLVSSAS